MCCKYVNNDIDSYIMKLMVWHNTGAITTGTDDSHMVIMLRQFYIYLAQA